VVIANTGETAAELNLTGIGDVKSAKIIADGVNLGDCDFTGEIPANSVLVLICE